MQDLAPGTHLVSQRHRAGLPLYTHHGIYAGDGIVIHYAGGSDDPIGDGSKVQNTTLEAFALGAEFGIISHPEAVYSNADVVARAASRLGEDGYSLFSNNCEHFCHWAIYGEHNSPQIDRGARLSSVATLIPGRLGAVAITAIGAASGLSGGAAMMSGLAYTGTLLGGAVGGIATAGAGLGLLAAATVNNTLLASSESHSEEETDARKAGRAASLAGVAGTTALTVGTISAAGVVPGLSAAGITSGLAAVGSTVGGGMAAGVAITVAAPAAAAIGGGYLAYKAAQKNEALRDAAVTAADTVSNVASQGAEVARRVVDVVTPVAQQVAVQAAHSVRQGAAEFGGLVQEKAPVLSDAATATAQSAKTGLRSLLSAVENGAAKLRQKLDNGS